MVSRPSDGSLPGVGRFVGCVLAFVPQHHIHIRPPLSARRIVFRCCLNRQCPMRRRKIMVCSFSSNWFKPQA